MKKRCGVPFTCLTMRTIHIIIASSLITDSTTMELRRFAARRGCPAEIYSDNGTNLRGADNEVRRACEEMDERYISSKALQYRVTWHFIPPQAPHMDGSWKRLVRNVKNALRVALKERTPKDETLVTMMTEVEHIINSRPLIHVSVNHRDDKALTLNHFLIGSSSGRMVLGRFSDDDLCLRKQWRILNDSQICSRIDGYGSIFPLCSRGNDGRWTHRPSP